jgi:hypothetical protein
MAYGNTSKEMDLFCGMPGLGFLCISSDAREIQLTEIAGRAWEGRTSGSVLYYCYVSKFFYLFLCGKFLYEKRSYVRTTPLVAHNLAPNPCVSIDQRDLLHSACVGSRDINTRGGLFHVR